MLMNPEAFQKMEKQMLEADSDKRAVNPALPNKIDYRMMITEGPVPDQILSQAQNPEDTHLFQASFDFSNLMINCVIDYKEKKMMNRVWPTFQNDEVHDEVDTGFVDLYIKVLNQALHDFGSIPNTIFVWLDSDGAATMAMPREV